MSYVAVKAVVILCDISKDRGLCCSFFCPLLVYLWRCHTLQLVVMEYSTQRKLGKTWVPSWTRLHRCPLSPPAIEVHRWGRKGSDRRGRERRRAHPCPCLDSAVGNTAPCLGLYLFMISACKGMIVILMDLRIKLFILSFTFLKYLTKVFCEHTW